jgi:hypothetical protein
MTAEPVTLPTLLGAKTTAELFEGLRLAEEQQASRWLGVYDPDTEFAAFVVVHEGAPFSWRLHGPLKPDQAHRFFKAEAQILSDLLERKVRH